MASLLKNIGALIISALGLDPATITAGAGNDNVAVNGNIIDLQGFGGKYDSAKLLVFYKTTLASAETLKIAAKLQDGAASNLSDAADYGDVYPLTTQQTGVQTNKRGVLELSFDLTGARRYIRPTVTADLSASGTDTVLIGAVLVLGGAQKLPAA